MPKVTFIFKDGSEKVVEAQAGLSIMEIAVREGIPGIEGSCGGSLACATCHAYVHPDWVARVMPESGAMSDEEQDMLDLAFDVRATSRLCCQILLTPERDGLVVALPGSRPVWV